MQNAEGAACACNMLICVHVLICAQVCACCERRKSAKKNLLPVGRGRRRNFWKERRDALHTHCLLGVWILRSRSMYFRLTAKPPPRRPYRKFLHEISFGIFQREVQDPLQYDPPPGWSASSHPAVSPSASLAASLAEVPGG